MLKKHASSAIVAVTDIARARRFYAEILGLEFESEMGGSVLVFRTGPTHLVVYQSNAAHGTTANAVVWGVGDDIEAIVADLKAKGVSFEHYPEISDDFDGAIHRSEGMRLVWLKDPDGNILHLNDVG